MIAIKKNRVIVPNNILTLINVILNFFRENYIFFYLKYTPLDGVVLFSNFIIDGKQIRIIVTPNNKFLIRAYFGKDIISFINCKPRDDIFEYLNQIMFFIMKSL